MTQHLKYNFYINYRLKNRQQHIKIIKQYQQNANKTQQPQNQNDAQP